MTQVTPGTWNLDASHTEVGFTVRHAGISKVRGTFQAVSGTLTVAEDFARSSADITVDMQSIDTKDANRDGHLKGEEFFDIAKFPTIKFVSTSMVKDGDGYKLTGNLTMKDVTKPVTLEAEYGGSAVDFYGNHKAGFEVTGKINRKEFGLTWGGITEAGAIVLGDDVKLIANVQFAKQA